GRRRPKAPLRRVETRSGEQTGGPGTPAALAAEKAALRSKLLAARALLTPQQRAESARALRGTVLALPQAQMAGTVAAYYSIGTEPDTHALVYALWKRGSYVLLPLLQPDLDLDWASYEGPDSLRPGPRGLTEPTEPPRGTNAVARADLVIVPALAVDRRGVRLGRGGGSYDPGLARVGTQVPAVVLLYGSGVLGHVPAGARRHSARPGAPPTPGDPHPPPPL